MKSYIQHLQQPADFRNASIIANDEEELSLCDYRLREGKPKVLVRSLSDPLLPIDNDRDHVIRRGRKRPNRRDALKRNKSLDGEHLHDWEVDHAACSKSSSTNNALKPTRRQSINHDATPTTTTTTTTDAAHSNAPKPTRRHSIDHTTTITSTSLHTTITNAIKPTRRGSINTSNNNKCDHDLENPTAATTSLTAAIRHQYNATRPTRRGSLETSKAKSCPDFSEEAADGNMPVPPRKLRTSQKNLLFRAKILYHALDDMGLFDNDDDDNVNSNKIVSGRGLDSLTLAPRLLGSPATTNMTM